jgi:hypothetical protein
MFKLINLFRLPPLSFPEKCSCGSGAHPRVCLKHPWNYQQHISDLNVDSLTDIVYDLEDKIEALEKQIAEIKEKMK